jgi:alpha-glucosidase
LLHARRASPALSAGAQAPVPAPEGVLAWRREAEGDLRVVAVNFTAEECGIDLGADLVVEVASDGSGEGAPFAGRLGPDQSVVLRPLRAADC